MNKVLRTFFIIESRDPEGNVLPPQLLEATREQLQMRNKFSFFCSGVRPRSACSF